MTLLVIFGALVVTKTPWGISQRTVAMGAVAISVAFDVVGFMLARWWGMGFAFTCFLTAFIAGGWFEASLRKSNGESRQSHSPDQEDETMPCLAHGQARSFHAALGVAHSHGSVRDALA
jgi:hypothetical protein